MTKKQLFAVSYFLGGTFFLGFGYSLLCKYTGKDAWIAILIGILLGSGIIYLLEKMKKLETTRTPKYKKLNNIIFFLFNLFLYSQILFAFQTFASSFFLIKSPNWFISLPIPFIIYKIAKGGITTIGRMTEILFPITLFLITLTFIGLTEHFKLDFFTPIMTTPLRDMLKGILLVTAYATTPYFLLLKVPLENNKLQKGYLVSSLTVLLLATLIIGILGPTLIKIYRYPEYMILKEVQIFSFIEKVENITSVAWLFNLFILLSITGYNLKTCLPKKKNNYFFIGLLALMYFVTVAESYFYPEELILYHTLPYIFLGLEILLITTSFFSYRKNKS